MNTSKGNFKLFLLKSYIEGILSEAKSDSTNHPLVDLPDFFFLRRRGDVFQYEASITPEEVKSVLTKKFRARTDVLPPGEGGNPSGTHSMYSVNAKTGPVKVIVSPPKNILSDGVIAVIAERAILHAVNETGSFDDAVAEESTGDSETGGNRLLAVARSKDADAKGNLEQIYDKLRGLAEQAVNEKKIKRGTGNIPKSTTAKVDIETGNAMIHVKYNDVKRLIGIQDVAGQKAGKASKSASNADKIAAQNKASKKSKVAMAAAAAEKEKDELAGNSTTLFRRLRNKFVRDLPVPGKRGKTFGSEADAKKLEPVQVLASMKGLESKLLYNDPEIRSNFISYLEQQGYVDSLRRDIEKFIVDASAVADPKRGGASTYFFVYTGKKPDKRTGQVDPDTIKLTVKQAQVTEATTVDRSGKETFRITVVPQEESPNVYLFDVLLDGEPTMKVEFRSIDGGGHPPQLHLAGHAEGLFNVSEYQ